MNKCQKVRLGTNLEGLERGEIVTARRRSVNVTQSNFTLKALLLVFPSSAYVLDLVMHLNDVIMVRLLAFLLLHL